MMLQRKGVTHTPRGQGKSSLSGKPFCGSCNCQARSALARMRGRPLPDGARGSALYRASSSTFLPAPPRGRQAGRSVTHSLPLSRGLHDTDPMRGRSTQISAGGPGPPQTPGESGRAHRPSARPLPFSLLLQGRSLSKKSLPFAVSALPFMAARRIRPFRLASSCPFGRGRRAVGTLLLEHVIHHEGYVPGDGHARCRPALRPFDPLVL